MCRSIMSLSKITHQIWGGHPCSQRNKTAERAVRVGVVDNMVGGESDQNFEKKGGRQYRGSS